MKREEFKALVKPIIKECIKEAILEEGVLSRIISEVLVGTSQVKNQVVENKVATKITTTSNVNSEQKQKLENYKKQLREEITSAPIESVPVATKVIKENLSKQFGGFDPFKGTAPLSDTQAPGSQQVSGLVEGDPGIDISGLKFGRIK